MGSTSRVPQKNSGLPTVVWSDWILFPIKAFTDLWFSPSSSLGITRSPSTVVPPSPTVVLPSPFSLLGEDHHIQRQTETESQERDHEEEHSTHEGLFELIGSFDDSISAKSVSTDDEGYLQGGADLILANGEFEVDGKIYTYVIPNNLLIFGILVIFFFWGLVEASELSWSSSRLLVGCCFLFAL